MNRELIILRNSANPPRGYRIAKRIFDIVASALGLLVLFPLFLLIAIVIMLEDGTPVFFKQRRIGKDGEPFHIYKFRSMVRNAEEVLRSRPDLLEEYHRTYKIANDPRILRVGKFLRASSLDEIPQLYNVLVGEMSLVGPRPIVEKELGMYGDDQSVYLSRKPGCAGLWQCSGRSDTTYEERVALDREYDRRASFLYDLNVLGRTFVSIVFARGAR